MNEYKNSEEEFEEYIIKLRNFYDKNPKDALYEAKNSLKRMREREKNRKLKINDINVDTLYLCILIMFIALVGFSNIEGIGIYLFGVIFFIAGHFVGLTQKGFGLIFLFSHSVTGLVVMEGSLLFKMFQSPLMEDNPINIYIVLGIIIFILFLATILVILYNLSDNLKKKEHIIILPLTIYFIAFVLSGILANLYEKLYYLHF